MKKILVTGGAGFIGSHLCKRLVMEGNRVICIDNYFTGSEKNIKQLIKYDNFQTIPFDVVNNITRASNGDYEINGINLNVQEIYNLACPASPPHYQLDPIKTAKTSVFGMINMLEIAKHCNAKVLQASTSEVYGDPEIHPQPESYKGCVNPIGIRACYDEGKRMAETLCFDYHRLHKLKIKVVRIFNTYGSNMNPEDGRVVSNFIVQALKGEDITVYGDGSQTRSFCYVNDLVDGLIRMMDSGDEIKGPINLGNPEEFTMLELAELVIKLTGTKSKIVYMHLPADDPTQRKPVIDLAREHLSWQPEVPLEEGLKKTIEYFSKIVR